MAYLAVLKIYISICLASVYSVSLSEMRQVALHHPVQTGVTQ